MSAKERRAAQQQLIAIPSNEERLLLATAATSAKGSRWRGTLVQYTGRLHRTHPGKTEVRIFDYVDRDVPMLLRMSQRRLRGYRAIGYARNQILPGDKPMSGGLIVEYDAETQRSAKSDGDFN